MPNIDVENFWERNQSWLLRVIPAVLGAAVAFTFGAYKVDWPLDVLAGIIVAVLVIALEVQWFSERAFTDTKESNKRVSVELADMRKDLLALGTFDNQIREFNQRLSDIPFRTPMEQDIAHRALNLAAEKFKIPREGVIYSPGRNLSIELYKYFWNMLSTKPPEQGSRAFTTHASDLTILLDGGQLLLNFQEKFIKEGGGTVFRILVDKSDGEQVAHYLRDMETMKEKGIVPVYLRLADLRDQTIDSDLCLLPGPKFALCWMLDDRGHVTGSEFVEGGIGYDHRYAQWDRLYSAVKDCTYEGLEEDSKDRLDRFRKSFQKLYEGNGRSPVRKRAGARAKVADKDPVPTDA